MKLASMAQNICILHSFSSLVLSLLPKYNLLRTFYSMILCDNNLHYEIKSAVLACIYELLVY